MKPSYVLYVFGLIGVLLFAANCSCESDVTDLLHFWIFGTFDLQSGNSGGSYPSLQGSYQGTRSTTRAQSMPCIPVLTNGNDVKPSTKGFDLTQFACPSAGTGAPIWIQSSAAYTTNGQPKPLGPGQGAYVPALELALPFPAQRAGSESTTINCILSQPDVFQVNNDNATVNRIGTCPFQAKATIPVAGHPLQIAFTPDGKTMLVTSLDNAVNFINPSTNTVTFTLSTGSMHPNGLAITPDGAFAYFTNFVSTSDTSISKIDLTTHAIVQTIPALAPYAQNVVLSPDGAQLWVTYPYSNSVQVLDTLTNAQIAVFSIQGPRGIAFNSKGTKAYIAEAGNPENATMSLVQEVDINTFTPGPSYKVGLGPNDVAVLYGDQFVVTSNFEGNSFSKINTVTGAVQTTLTSAQVSGLAIVY
ncbi:MAG TPA: YncE family protein [Bryobacteraceae bacterium]|nr:YncE family protein [Bryobacteraceae bacterium]